MAYCYEGKTYETIKELAEEYGIVVRESILSVTGVVTGRSNTDVHR